MKPSRYSPAHKSPDLAELVCSNSFRAKDPYNAVGLLKEEMQRLGSIVMEAALLTQVPAGGALAVDRTLFSRKVTEKLEQRGNIEIRRQEFTSLPTGTAPLVLSPGPLASDAIVSIVTKLTGAQNLSFYDALAPIVSYDSLDHSRLFAQDRYGAPGGDYLNAPMDKEEFYIFYDALMEADKVKPRPFEEKRFFEGCLPIEVMAHRGIKTLTYGPMKPVGLTDPKTGRRPFAAVQLRRENKSGTSWNLVGFQTRLTRPAQEKVLRLIPGFQKAEFLRYGAIHRNSYLDAPKVLDPYQRLLASPNIFIAGQFSGVEGYVESAAQGILAGENAARALTGRKLLSPPRTTALGSLVSHLEAVAKGQPFSPSNINFGLFPPPPSHLTRHQTQSWRLSTARSDLDPFIRELASCPS
jgi:methylenetetrahydrofolate--tRNA-(uracil-5-)-methyltransferase